MTTRPSNLLVIMSDEHQARAMGCAGHGFVQTPHLDRLAARGMRFTNAYTPSPICVPARAAFATGRYVHQIGHWDNAMPYTGVVPGWGHALQAAGVPCQSIGKLHYRAPQDPSGFDQQHIPMHVVGGHGMVWASIRDEARRASPRDTRMLGDYIGPGESSYTTYDRQVVDRTRDWLAQAPDQPWCLYVGLVAPHFPLVAPPAFFDLYPDVPEPKLNPRDGYVRHPWVEKQNAFMDSEARFKTAQERRDALTAYYALCSWVDHNVGQILGALEAAGLADDTTVVYTSDHGDNAGARGLWGKSNMYEESAAVPMIMAGPQVAPGTCVTPVSLLDLSATIADHFGCALDGVGTPLPRLATGAEPDRAVFSEYHAAGAVSGAFMLRKGKWKLISYVGFADELFDMDKNPEELISVADTEPQALAQMRAEMAKICDIDAVNAQAFADQAAMIDRYGGVAVAMTMGAPGATPPPQG